MFKKEAAVFIGRSCMYHSSDGKHCSELCVVLGRSRVHIRDKQLNRVEVSVEPKPEWTEWSLTAWSLSADVSWYFQSMFTSVYLRECVDSGSSADLLVWSFLCSLPSEDTRAHGNVSSLWFLGNKHSVSEKLLWPQNLFLFFSNFIQSLPKQ